MEPFILITVVTLIAGVGGTGLGGIVGALFKTDSSRTVSLLLSFAAGVMLAIVCFDLLTEAVEAAEFVAEPAVVIVVMAVLLGIVVVYGLNHLIDKRTKDEVPHAANPDHPKTHDHLDELIHADHYMQHQKQNDPKRSLLVAGVVMAAAIALHNVPEGMTIGAGYAVQGEEIIGTGLILAILIGLHNIPEGMAVSVPLISGGMRRMRAILIAAASGLPTVLGAWFGFWLGDIGPLGLSVSLGFASGAMLYVVFGEILPQAILMYRSKLPAFSAIIGILLGMLIIFL